MSTFFKIPDDTNYTATTPVNGVAIVDTTITITHDTTIDALYNYAKQYLTNNLDIENFVHQDNAILNISNYALVADGATLSSGTIFTSLRTTASITSINDGSVSCVYADSTQNSAVEIIGVDIASQGYSLEVSIDSKQIWTALRSTVYPYLQSDTSTLIHFRYTTPDTVTVGTYDLVQGGIGNKYTKFTSDVGILLNASDKQRASEVAQIQTAITAIPTTTKESLQDKITQLHNDLTT